MEYDIENLRGLLSKRIVESVSDSHGISCHFYRMNNEIGAKTYYCKREADYTFRMQWIVNRYGLAPKTIGAVFCCQKDTYEERWCYFTQIAQPLRSLIPENKPLIAVKDSRNGWCLDAIILPAKEKLYNLGIEFYDDHYHNWGVIDGKVMIIDFDQLAFKPKQPVPA